MITDFNRPQPQRQAPEAKVFTPDFRARLAMLTHAERELRGMGLQVLWSSLGGTAPQAHIRRDTKVSIAGLLDRMGPRSFRPEDGYTMASGDFLGVIVSWCEPN